MTVIPTLKTERLVLKEINESDFPSYEKHFNDYNVIRHLAAAVPWPFPKNGVRDYYLGNIKPQLGKDKWMWGIFLKTKPSELIGAVELWRQCSPENRGFWLGAKFWGQGLMTEATSAINDYAFNELAFETLVFSNAKGNMGSHQVKVKTGAKLTGIEPAKFVDPGYTEQEVWQLDKENWIAFKKSKL